MRLIVTGGAGFLGSHVVALALLGGHDVLVLDDLSTGRRSNLPKGVALRTLDVTSPETPALVAAWQPDAVLHAAAQPSAAAAVGDPAHDLAVNAVGTLRVLEACRLLPGAKLVYVSSAAVYGQPAALPISEEAPCRPAGPYGASKSAAEAYVRLYGSLYGLNWTIVRPGNIYGPRQSAGGDGAVVPAMMAAFAAGQDPTIHGDGRATRDFLHASDAAALLVAALATPPDTVLNAGSGQPVSIRQLWDLLAGLFGWSRPPRFGPPRTGDIVHSVLDIGRARALLGWSPAVTLAAGLAATVAWYTGLAPR